MGKINVSLILACYNEGPTFEKSVSQIIVACQKLKKGWEIIFVDDKSVDETKKTIEKFSKNLKNSRAIFHRQNMGRGKSVTDGMKVARGDICGYLDVDLEVSQNYIPLFISEIESGADMVIGKRYYEKGIDAISRLVASKGYSFLVKTLLNLPVTDTEAGYKFFRRRKILPILAKVDDKRWFWDTEICARAYWAGLKISEIPVLFIRRSDKKSTVNLLSDTLSYLKNLISFRNQIPASFR